MKEKIQKYLTNQNIKPNLIGFDYLTEGILFLMQFENATEVSLKNEVLQYLCEKFQQPLTNIVAGINRATKGTAAENLTTKKFLVAAALNIKNNWHGNILSLYIVKGLNSGVYLGKVKEKEGQEILMVDCIKICESEGCILEDLILLNEQLIAAYNSSPKIEDLMVLDAIQIAKVSGT